MHDFGHGVKHRADRLYLVHCDQIETALPWQRASRKGTYHKDSDYLWPFDFVQIGFRVDYVLQPLVRGAGTRVSYAVDVRGCHAAAVGHHTHMHYFLFAPAQLYPG